MLFYKTNYQLLHAIILLVNEYSVLVPSLVQCSLPMGNLYIGSMLVRGRVHSLHSDNFVIPVYAICYSRHGMARKCKHIAAPTARLLIWC